VNAADGPRVVLSFVDLFGERRDPSDNPPVTGRLAATIRCTCGRQLGEVRVDGDVEVVVAREVRLTREHAASEVIDVLLRDFEHLYERREDALRDVEG
jgi:hypothetical protein